MSNVIPFRQKTHLILGFVLHGYCLAEPYFSDQRSRLGRYPGVRQVAEGSFGDTNSRAPSKLVCNKNMFSMALDLFHEIITLGKEYVYLGVRIRVTEAA